MNKLYLIRKTEIDLMTNRNNLNFTIKYLKNKYPLKIQELVEIENVGIKKYKEAYSYILELITIERNINQLDSRFNNYHDNTLKLVILIVLLFLVSIFLLDTLFNHFTIMNVSFLWKLVCTIFVGGINLYLALEKYEDIRYKNESFNKYKNTRNKLTDDFEEKYEKVLEKICWFELQSDYLLKETESNTNNHQTKLENIMEVKEAFSKESCEGNNKTFVKRYKKR